MAAFAAATLSGNTETSPNVAGERTLHRAIKGKGLRDKARGPRLRTVTVAVVEGEELTGTAAIPEPAEVGEMERQEAMGRMIQGTEVHQQEVLI